MAITTSHLAAGLAALVLSTGVFADSAQPEPKIVIGAATENVLEMQQSGSHAGHPQPLRGDIATHSYKRYMDSFDTPMPEFTETVSSSTQMSGSGSR